MVVNTTYQILAKIKQIDTNKKMSERIESSRSGSSELKFGMDRILSREESSKKTEEVSSTTMPPCAGCIGSIFRCCSTTIPSPATGPYHSYYTTRIHTPQPLRPYTNVLLPADSASDIGQTSSNSTGKRKRSWSRAVFSNLQRKGLEKRFQLQKYITKPDRRQLAATLGLTDAQVKVWFQNRRMKWRHTKDSKLATSLDDVLDKNSTDHTIPRDSDSETDIDIQTIDS